MTGLHEDPVPWVVTTQQRHRVTDLSLDRDIGDQPLAGLIVGAGLVAPVRITVRVTVHDIEQQHGVVAAGRIEVGSGHALTPSLSVWGASSPCSTGRSVCFLFAAAAIRSARSSARCW